MVKYIILLALVATGSAVLLSLDSFTSSAIARAGANVVKENITKEAAMVKAAYAIALMEFEEANATCVELAKAAGSDCVGCVRSECQDRAEDACSTPIGDFINFWEDDFVNFWADDFVNFWEDDFVDFWEDDFAGFFKNDVANFFTEDFAGAFESLGKSIESGFVDIGEGLEIAFNEVGDAIDVAIDELEDVVGDIGDFFSDDFANFFADDVANFFTDDFAGAFEDVGDFFSDLFGKRKRSLKKGLASVQKIQRKKRAGSEPSCSELQADGSSCMYYTDGCPGCNFNADTECPGYADAKQGAIDASQAGTWIVGLTESDDYSYGITSFVYNTDNVNPLNGKFSECEVIASFFGTELSFTVNEPVNIYNAAVSGPIVAQQAIEEYLSGF